MRIVNDINIGTCFKLRNFASPDTDEVVIFPKLLIALESLREIVGPGLFITSGYRTPEHNKAVGGAPKSYHLQGMAVDVIYPRIKLDKLAQAAKKVGFTGIIVHKGHVHLDIRPKEKAYFSGFTPEAKSSV